MSKNKCRNCNAKIPEGAKFCLECGQKVVFMDIQEDFSDYDEYEETPSNDEPSYADPEPEDYEVEDPVEEDYQKESDTPADNGSDNGEWDEWNDYTDEETEEAEPSQEDVETHSYYDDVKEESEEVEQPKPPKKEKPVDIAPPKSGKVIGGGFEDAAQRQAPAKKKKKETPQSTPVKKKEAVPAAEDQVQSKPQRLPKKVETVSTYDPNHDHYYDDVLPDLLNEIEKSPIELILKIVGAVIFLIAVILYCVYFL